MKIGLLWSRYGPYHAARLKGAREAAGTVGAGIEGIEVTADDDTYAWQRLGSERESKSTVFPGKKYEAISGQQVRQGVIGVLNEAGCDMVAVNGWAAPEARGGLAWAKADRRRRAILMSETKRDDAPRTWWREWIKTLVVRQYDVALVGGRKQAEYLGKLGFPKDRIFYGYDSVDNDYFERHAAGIRADANRFREEYGLPRRYFLCCTRFIKRKNVENLLTAYSRYRDQSETGAWALVVLGSGEEEDRLKRREAELGVEGVIWPGFVQYDVLPVYYGLASAFIHPAKVEAWGLVVNEAAASGLPLLVSETVGARYELLDDGNNGFLLDPFDVDDMAAAMLRMSGMREEKRKQMGERSRSIVAGWSPRRFGEQLLRAAEVASSLPGR